MEMAAILDFEDGFGILVSLKWIYPINLKLVYNLHASLCKWQDMFFLQTNLNMLFLDLFLA